MKLLFLFPALFVLISLPATAADFVATIGSDHIKSGESFTLHLTLSGTKAEGSPDIGALTQSFTIVSEVPVSDAASDNAGSTGVGWRLILVPKSEGQLTIAPVMIETGAGLLRTAPLRLEVDRGSTPISSQTNIAGGIVSITAIASTTKPYQNQSIQYIVRCVLRGSISDASLGEVLVNNAIVEQQGKPDIHDQIENGSVVRTIEFHYIITPLLPGALTIPPVVMQGKITTPDIAGVTDRFSSGMRQVMNFLSAFGDEPFSVASNKIELQVKPPAARMDPWLPLTSLRILEDTRFSQRVQVGEPLTRRITLLADGAVGGQLPSLEARQGRTNFRIYADKATTGEDLDRKSGMILGWRKESYTLIAQKAGRLVLPAIKLRWWDIANNKLATAQLPEQVVNVLPVAAEQNLSPVGGPATGRPAPVQSTKARGMPAIVASLLLSGLIALLLSILLFRAFWGARLWHRRNPRKVDNASAPLAAQPQPRKSAPRPVAERDLEHVRTAEELRKFLQAYAQERCGVSENTVLDRSLLALSTSWPAKERDDVDAVIKEIGAALYAGKVVEVEDLKNRCRRIIAALKRQSKNSQKDGEKLRCLNPS